MWIAGPTDVAVQEFSNSDTRPDRDLERVDRHRVSKEIPGALPLLWNFFNKLETPDWLPHLAKRNLLSAPLSQADEAAGVADNLCLRIVLQMHGERKRRSQSLSKRACMINQSPAEAFA